MTTAMEGRWWADWIRYLLEGEVHDGELELILLALPCVVGAIWGHGSQGCHDYHDQN